METKTPLQLTCRRRDERKAFAKTQWCRFFLKDQCTRGDSCTFAHGCEELKQSPDFSRTRICRLFKEGKCRDTSCKFAHSHDELRSTSDVYRTELCSFHASGSCLAGDGCRYAHGEAKLRKLTDQPETKPVGEINMPNCCGSPPSTTSQATTCCQNGPSEETWTPPQPVEEPRVINPSNILPGALENTTENVQKIEYRQPQVFGSEFQRAPRNPQLVCDSEGRLYSLVPVMFMYPNTNLNDVPIEE